MFSQRAFIQLLLGRVKLLLAEVAYELDSEFYFWKSVFPKTVPIETAEVSCLPTPPSGGDIILSNEAAFLHSQTWRGFQVNESLSY